jgi:MoaA/NifB/PqqE/SkfB family radical SAM enzyme
MTWIDAIQRAPGFLRDALRYRAGWSIQPRTLTHTVTFRCNARCIMCDSWKMSGKGDLSLEEIESIYRQLPRMDAVRLTGGEPFVRTDLLEIVAIAHRYLRPLGMHITTNGFLTDRIVDLCSKRPRSFPLQIMVSLDGMQDKHNHIRGSSIAWTSATKTLELLAQHRRQWRLDLAVNQTIVDSEGVEQYRQLREFLAPLGIRHQAVMAYDVSATYNMEREIDVAPKQFGQFTTFGDFSRDDLKALFAEIEHDLQRLPRWARAAKRYYLEGIRQRLLPSDAEGGWNNPACVALRAHLRIFPNGDVPTCQFNTKTIGNLRETPFKDLWGSLKAETQRDWVRNCPGCWAECEVLPSAIYTLDLVRPRKEHRHLDTKPLQPVEVA